MKFLNVNQNIFPNMTPREKAIRDHHENRKMTANCRFCSCGVLLTLPKKLTSIMAIVEWFDFGKHLEPLRRKRLRACCAAQLLQNVDS
ncbi:hypothetical protein KIN20_010169 [Parelaphostrongylus tenuis]|uniref:Uncharacterized protein n=1 Tax=Parelaphostrongylus tenuis TaxID=148309 RepID=A0AAD5MB11_PARTN|nr:hypothetical protein KIN20_010169 [Parelaphostrongylus tenuis]